MNPKLAAVVVHDLKNALGDLEAQLIELQKQPTAEKAIVARAHCADLRARFVAYLLLYGQEGQLKAMVGDESPADFLASLISNLFKGNCTAEHELGPCKDAPPFWYFDHRLVRLALDAALHNAWLFARKRIVLDVRLEAGYLVFSIDDDGPGLGDMQSDQWSTGLGTALCDEIAKAHRNGDKQGRIELFNRPEGGARFELWLP